MVDLKPRALKPLSTRTIEFLGSYGLACVLLGCLFVLTFQGTWYQVDHGLHAAKKRFFESFFVWFELGGMSVPIFPGGVTCMGLLTVNMLLGGLLTLRITARNVGAVVVHLGVAFLLFAGLFKLVYAEEGNLRLFEGQDSDHYESYRDWEVAIWKLGGEGAVVEHVIDDDLFRDLTDGGRRTFTSPEIPFDLVLSGFVRNAKVVPAGGGATNVAGFRLSSLPLSSESERDVAGLVAEARIGEDSRSGLLWGFGPLPWTVRVDEQDWAVDLRHARYSMPFNIRLEDFEKEDHPGMMMARAFRSYVTRTDEKGSERVLIEMNEPLRDGGLVVYQSGWGPPGGREEERLYSVFSVVRNRSDRWPEYGMWVIIVGLLLFYGKQLRGFVRAQVARRAGEEGGNR
jgi:hypothetical protein